MKLDDGSTYSGTVTAAEQFEVNNFTGFGLVDADAAVRRVQRHK